MSSKTYSSYLESIRACSELKGYSRAIVFYILLLLLFITTTNLLASQSPSDSLKILLSKTNDEKTKALLYSQLGKSLIYTDRDSAIYFAEKGLTFSKSINSAYDIAENSAVLGDIMIMDDQLEEARINYLVAAENFHTSEKHFDYTQITMILGNISLAQNDYINALKSYQVCLDVALKNSFNSLIPHLYNNIGLVYLRIEDYTEANLNFEEAYKLFTELDDDYSAALSLSNISDIYSLQGKEAKAISGYLDVIRVLSENENWVDIAGAYNSISDIYFKNEDYGKSEKYLELALKTMENSSGRFDGPQSYHSTKILITAAKLAIHKKEWDKCMNYAKESLKLSLINSYKENIVENAKMISQVFKRKNLPDSALFYNELYIQHYEDIQAENNIKQLTQLKMQHEFDAAIQEKKLENVQNEAEYRRKELLYIGSLIFVVLSVFIMILLFINQKSKTGTAILKKENLELEKAKLNQELNYKNKELATNMMYLLEKNEFITSIAQKLSEIKTDAKQSNQVILQQLIIELKKNASKEIWKEFELYFKQVHSEFYKALNEQFPHLSPNEKKICAFLRLNMSTKEISAITYQSVKSINMARFRLRKKMNLERDENLIAFLSQL